MSCLPSDALSRFEQREQEFLALNQELEEKKRQALQDASGAFRDAEASSLNSRLYRPLEDRFSVASSPSMLARQEQEFGEHGLGVEPALSAAASAAAAAVSLSRPSSSGSRHPGGGVGMDGGGSESLHTTIRLQNARIIALQEELDKTISELASRDGEVQQLRQEAKQATGESKRLQKISTSADQVQDRLKTQLAAADSKIQELEREKAELSRDADQVGLQQRKHEADSSTKEARINRLAEECEKYKAQLRETTTHDRDRATADRREMDRLTAEVRKLERQRTELVNAFKKQMKLIEVLKRQRAHMEAARVLSFTEEEFIRILELGDKLGE